MVSLLASPNLFPHWNAVFRINKSSKNSPILEILSSIEERWMNRKSIASRSGQPGQRTFRPPLRALVAFEAAARLNSFNAAAQELLLTPSAISHQITGIERQIGVELFARI